MSYLKSPLLLDISRKLAFYVFEFIFEEEIDSEADFARKRVIAEFPRKEHL